MPLSRVGWTFLRIGAVAFGGLGATLALLDNELVQRQKVTTKDELTEALTYTKLLPGSTVVQVVAYLGWRLAGWRGSATATVAFLLPSFLLMLTLAYSYAHLAGGPAAAPVRRGVLAGVVALLILTMNRLAKPVLTARIPIALALASFVVVVVWQVTAVWVVVLAGLIGVLATRSR
jgi:chromate transporter